MCIQISLSRTIVNIHRDNKGSYIVLGKLLFVAKRNSQSSGSNTKHYKRVLFKRNHVTISNNSRLYSGALFGLRNLQNALIKNSIVIVIIKGKIVLKKPSQKASKNSINNLALKFEYFFICSLFLVLI